jgi:RNA polymerase sigma-70 factor (ECF subfamily)
MFESPDDTNLVERLLNDEVEAFDLLYYRYSGKLYKFCYKYLRSREDSEEMIQSVFMRIWENRSNLDTELSFKSYIFTIAYNDICKFFRKQSHHKKYIEEAIYENDLITNQTENKVENKLLIEQVERIIERMPERQKTVFLKSRMHGKSSKEIAEELGISSGTVDNYISGSLKFIRENLQKENNG